MERLHIEDSKFKNAAGAEVLLQGINFVCKEKEEGYLFADHKRLFHSFADKGFNLIRLGIFWDAIEPQPGVYDDAYLDKISAVIDDAEAEGLYVLMDMHQDLWSVLYADGAPEWATLTDGAEHPSDCAMWFDAYLRSEAVINAADHFWKNDPAEDGTGLMDHYAAMWIHIVKKLDGHTNIIGYEPMNEPFMGSLARNSFGYAGMKTAEKFPGCNIMTMQGITPESQAYFSEIISGAFMDWDRSVLMPFYQKMNDAIRLYTEKALTTGGNIYCSSNFSSGIERVTGAEGVPETQQIYAPHGYDSVVDSDNYENFSQENVAALFAEKRQKQESLGMPVIVGEWGAFPSRDFSNILIDQMNEILEKYLWSSTYWQYLPGMENDENYSALSRAYPAEVSGELESYRYDRSAGTLEISWNGGEVLCYLPFKEAELRSGACGDSAINSCIEKQSENGMWMKLMPNGNGAHSIVIAAK